ncbi:MAG: DUF2085 domain-containing protein, partial [Chloroflexota bacterium]
ILVLSRHWFLVANLLAGTILALAFLAPALLALGRPEAAQAVYGWLAPHDHQLPQRSYFLFGRSGWLQSYSLEQVLAWGANPANLRAFVGNPEIGFKMGLNQRMAAIFTAIFCGGLGWGLAGKRPRLGAVGFLLLALPLLLDGFSHMLSENSGQGFRASNAWAVNLTGGVLPDWFYAGSTIGSLNWLLRTLTGLLFGLGLVWFLFTYLSYRFGMMRAQLETRLRKIGGIS